MNSEGALRLSPELVIPSHELLWQFSRSSGPGGQSVNTTDSRVQLTWCPGASAALTPAQKARVRQRLGGRLRDGCLTVTESGSRSQWQNRRVAAERLTELIRGALKPRKRRRSTRPTRSAMERRLRAKRRRAILKADRAKLDDD